MPKNPSSSILRWLEHTGPALAVLCLGVASLDPTVRADGDPKAEALESNAPPQAKPGVKFTDIARQAGLGEAINTSGGTEFKTYLLEETGNGAAFFDYDGDGWLDIFLVNGSRLKGFPPGSEPSNYLFRNQRNGTFVDLTRQAGLVRSGWGQGVCIGDYDNDGRDDLYVTYWGMNVLYRNRGDGTFEDVSEIAGVAGRTRRWNTGCTFLDYDRDSDLDLFVANYVNFDPSLAPPRGANKYCLLNGFLGACGPQGLGGGTNLLYQNQGDGTFLDVSEQSGVTIPLGPPTPTSVEKNWRPEGSYGLGTTAADFDNDGWMDIYVASDSAPSLLYHNNRNGTFTEIGIMAGCALNEHGLEQSGMGIGVGDYNGDGWLDIVKTNFADDTPNLYRNTGFGTFYDATYQSGLGVNTKFLGWGTGFFDFDNDGWKDIFIANGHLDPKVDELKAHYTYKEQRLLYRNRGEGRFQDVSLESGSGISDPSPSRGSAFGDFDNDGDVDILVNNMNEPPSLLRNEGGNRGNWILIKCLGTRSNRSAIGTRVQVITGDHTQTDVVMSGSSYISQNDLRLHFGLGEAEKVDLIKVQWPSGEEESFQNVQVNQWIVIEENKGIVSERTFTPAN